MDRFARNYLIVLGLIIAGVVIWVNLGRDPRVVEINERLAADLQLADYPYPFRVLRLEGDVAVMGSPRSAQVPVMQFLRAAYPALRRTAVTDPAMMAAQDELARRQEYAADLVRNQDGVRQVSWEIDLGWYRERGIFLPD